MSEPKRLPIKGTFRTVLSHFCPPETRNLRWPHDRRSQRLKGALFPVDGVERGHGVALSGHQPVDQEIGEQHQT